MTSAAGVTSTARRRRGGRGGSRLTVPLCITHWGRSCGAATTAGLGQGCWSLRHATPGLQLQRARRRSMAVTPPRRTSMWSISTRARPAGGGGRATKRRGIQEEDGRQARTDGAPDALGEVGRLEQLGGGRKTPTAAPQQGYVCDTGGATPSTEEGVDLRGFNSARAHLLL